MARPDRLHDARLRAGQLALTDRRPAARCARLARLAAAVHVRRDAKGAERVGGRVVGEPSLELTGFAPADGARPGDLTFAENEAYFLRADQSAASAILVAGEFRSSTGKTLRAKSFMASTLRWASRWMTPASNFSKRYRLG